MSSMASPTLENSADPAYNASTVDYHWHQPQQKRKKNTGGGHNLAPKKKRSKSSKKGNSRSASEGKASIAYDESDDEEELLVDCLLDEQVCHKCEENIKPYEPPAMQCDKKCYRVFHRKCVAQHIRPNGQFVCFVCLLGGKWCFVCKSVIGRTETFETCEIAECRNCFHSKCIENLDEKSGNNKFICAHHYCLTCAIEDKKPTKGKFLTCIKCPAAYHKMDRCIPAGTVHLNQKWIICTSHRNNAITSPKKTNVNFCFVCGLGGTLICCESCPCAIHLECYGLKIAPDDGFICSTCDKGEKQMYGDIVWAKFGSHRWWPAEIVHPLKVPNNLDKYIGEPGVFIVHFFGPTNDYAPLTQRNVYPFQDDDVDDERTAKYFQKSNKDKKFAQAILEARQAVKDHQYVQLCNPPVYKYIQNNKYSSDMTKEVNKADLCSPSCHCTVKDENPCGDVSCENRSLFTECDPEDCPASQVCQNQRFTKKQYIPTTKFLTMDRGYGLRTLVAIQKGDFVIEYVGEVITKEECSRRLNKNRDKPERAFYFLQLSNDRIIDAERMGNDSRFVNHSCEANCHTERWIVRGEYRIGLFANKDINAGEELTFHYNLDSLNGDFQTPCRCNESSCSGFIGKIVKKNGNGNGNSTKR